MPTSELGFCGIPVHQRPASEIELVRFREQLKQMESSHAPCNTQEAFRRFVARAEAGESVVGEANIPEFACGSCQDTQKCHRCDGTGDVEAEVPSHPRRWWRFWG